MYTITIVIIVLLALTLSDYGKIHWRTGDNFIDLYSNIFREREKLEVFPPSRIVINTDVGEGM